MSFEDPGSAPSLAGYFSTVIEPWMDVLFVGLSPEMVSAEIYPNYLATVKPGGNIPRDPWDAAFVRWQEGRSELVRQAAEAAFSTLRHGGILAIVSPPPSPSDQPALLLHDLGTDVEKVRCADSTIIAHTRRDTAGRQDLVGLRRSINLLRKHVDVVEALCADVRERSSTRRPLHQTWSLRERIGHLGDRDRDGYHASIAAALHGKPTTDPVDFQNLVQTRDHNGRTVAELVTRFRHFRSQSLELIEGIHEDTWLLLATGPDGKSAPLSELIRAWAREEELQLDALRSLIQ